jgi:hypothetical protein
VTVGPEPCANSGVPSPFHLKLNPIELLPVPELKRAMRRDPASSETSVGHGGRRLLKTDQVSVPATLTAGPRLLLPMAPRLRGEHGHRLRSFAKPPP